MTYPHMVCNDSMVCNKSLRGYLSSVCIKSTGACHGCLPNKSDSIVKIYAFSQNINVKHTHTVYLLKPIHTWYA